jgi:hypothetical protein
MRGHVLQMSRRWHHAAQSLGTGERFVWMRRGFYRVDVIMVGAWMTRVARQDGLQRRHDFLGAWCWLAI